MSAKFRTTKEIWWPIKAKVPTEYKKFDIVEFKVKFKVMDATERDAFVQKISMDADASQEERIAAEVEAIATIVESILAWDLQDEQGKEMPCDATHLETVMNELPFRGAITKAFNDCLMNAAAKN